MGSRMTDKAWADSCRVICDSVSPAACVASRNSCSALFCCWAIAACAPYKILNNALRLHTTLRPEEK